MSERNRATPHLDEQQDFALRPGWPSYLTYLAVPAFLVGLGLIAVSKVTFGLAENLVFFLLPATAAGVALGKLLPTRMGLSAGRLRLQRFIFRDLRLQRLSLSNDDVEFGLLSNRLGVKFEVEARSGLKIVPVSLLYLELRAGRNPDKIAFDVSHFDNRQVSELVRRFPRISREGYGSFPRP